jgi:hypothetical protein
MNVTNAHLIGRREPHEYLISLNKEREELDEKCKLLHQFLMAPEFMRAPHSERTRLLKQFGFMCGYRGMLEARAEALAAMILESESVSVQ